MTTGEGPRYDVAAALAAHIVNMLGGDYPGGSAELFSRVLFLILDGFYEVEDRLSASRFEPSDN